MDFAPRTPSAALRQAQVLAKDEKAPAPGFQQQLHGGEMRAGRGDTVLWDKRARAPRAVTRDEVGARSPVSPSGGGAPLPAAPGSALMARMDSTGIGWEAPCPPAPCVPPVAAGAAVRPRISGRGRPLEDPGCAGCAHLGTLWALRRAGIEAHGAMGCEPCAAPPADSGRFATVASARDLRSAGAASLLAREGEAGGRFVLLADRAGARGAEGAADALARAGARVRAFDPSRLEEARAAVAWAEAAGPGAALVALAPCVRGAARSAPLAIAPSRCNRCGACISLGCPAISDPGEDALAIDPGVCTGCGACAPLCRSRAIVLP